MDEEKCRGRDGEDPLDARQIQRVIIIESPRYIRTIVGYYDGFGEQAHILNRAPLLPQLTRRADIGRSVCRVGKSVRMAGKS